MKKIVLKIRSLHTSVNTKFLVLLLMLMFVDYAGYGYYVFYLPFLYLLLHKGFRIDWTFLLLVIWGGSYGFINYINGGGLVYISVLMPMINCPVLYMAGKYVARYNDSKALVFILFLFTFSIALISILSVLSDVAKNGFLVVGMARNVPLIGINNLEGYIAATGISSRLMLLTSFLVFIMFPYEGTKKFLFVGSALLAIYCAIRVQSRTTIVGLALILFLMMVWRLKSLSKKQKCLLLVGIGIIVCVVSYTLSHYSDNLAIINRFQSDELETGGGRMERLLNVAIHMWSYPLGDMGSDITYAHNLWFDCARLTGLLPFTLLILISFKYVRGLLNVINSINVDLFLRYVLVMLSLALLMVFLSEPVLEGMPMIFEFFCFQLGVVMHCNAIHLKMSCKRPKLTYCES